MSNNNTTPSFPIQAAVIRQREDRNVHPWMHNWMEISEVVCRFWDVHLHFRAVFELHRVCAVQVLRDFRRCKTSRAKFLTTRKLEMGDHRVQGSG